MREKWRAEFTDGFDLWHLHVPRAALEEIIGRSNVEWALPPAMAAPDPVLASLIDALRPTPIGGSSSPLFVDQMLAAIVTHLASRYFQIGEAAAPRAGLGPDQEKLAKDMLEAVGRSGNRLADVASACGLSIGQFARRFRATTGLPPHRWLTSMRVARARDLLAHSNLTLAEIAMRCGFADQSHLIRVFRTAMGSSPGRWRREMIGSTLDTDDDGSL
ncbi:helix-turn-helix transcriptional regulator [Sphingomonas oleivorans]|nr:AraC family transcriptional regulator [Sphingomonas oleivorans]